MTTPRTRTARPVQSAKRAAHKSEQEPETDRQDVADGGSAGALSPREQQLLAALLEQPTIQKAAKVARVPERTCYRWLAAAPFKAAYAEARRQAMQQATARLQHAAGQAVETLEEIMGDSDAPSTARVSAARATLEIAYRAVEIEDLTERIAALEATAAKEEVTT
ncbi:MAG: hypothetical protein JXR83_09480 [Deltaproteobacteria bacterium]|nr:hypothetical protein [Deltaproteobacteria bacterium]